MSIKASVSLLMIPSLKTLTKTFGLELFSLHFRLFYTSKCIYLAHSEKGCNIKTHFLIFVGVLCQVCIIPSAFYGYDFARNSIQAKFEH
jgi:hypothetical protein